MPGKRRLLSAVLIRLSIVFTRPAINIYSHDLMRLVSFYEGLGFRETFRTPTEGTPVHVEVIMDGFTIGIAAVDAAIADHGLNPNLAGRPVEIVLWTDDADRDYARLTTEGAPRSAPRTTSSPTFALRGSPTPTATRSSWLRSASDGNLDRRR